LLADRPIRRWQAVFKATELLLPAWLAPSRRSKAPNVVVNFDDYDTAAFARVAARFAADRYDYVVTPNVDHLIRLHDDPSFRALYGTAAWVLLDSRFLARLLGVGRGLQLPVCTGSDLTATLLSEVISPDDALVLVGGTPAQARQIAARYGLRQLAHFNPPMGFIQDPAAVETCLRFIEANSPFRFCLLALGSPQQEIIAQRLKTRGIACGLALCVGASIDFLTGDERRAPPYLQRVGLEWAFRLLQSPRRLGGRYLLRGPRIFGLLRRTTIVLRPAARPGLPASTPATLLLPAHTGVRPLGDNFPNEPASTPTDRIVARTTTRRRHASRPGGRRPGEHTGGLRERERIGPSPG
ncbi:MAG: WecB/TagA/CpsF family glycosyltransferase, partial [Gammaproteobacteria bacterium]